VTAATLAAKIFRFMMAVTAAFDLETEQFDAINAFLNSEIDRETYIRMPEGFQVQNPTTKTILSLSEAILLPL
jgi:hypothetical protein